MSLPVSCATVLLGCSAQTKLWKANRWLDRLQRARHGVAPMPDVFARIMSQPACMKRCGMTSYMRSCIDLDAACTCPASKLRQLHFANDILPMKTQKESACSKCHNVMCVSAICASRVHIKVHISRIKRGLSWKWRMPEVNLAVSCITVESGFPPLKMKSSVLPLLGYLRVSLSGPRSYTEAPGFHHPEPRLNI